MMSVENLTTYENWNICQPTIPSRSRLFSLEPIGLGTPQVESLTSYVSRLSVSHAVSTSILFKKELQPLIVKKYGVANLHKISRYSQALNGTGIMTQDLVRGISTLTFRSNLQFLTLLPWLDLFPTRQLLRSHRAWCPCCYSHQFHHQEIIYEPLLWSFQAVRLCPYHLIPLASSCPQCGKENIPLTGSSRPGLCSKCGAWLGDSNQYHSLNQSLPSSDLDWEQWKATNIGNLLQKSSSGHDFSSKTAIALSLQLCVEQIARGNMALLARQLQIKKNTLWLWCKGQNFPTLPALLKVCYCLKVSVWDFLHQTFDFPVSPSIPPKLNQRPRSFSQSFDTLDLKKSLQNFLNDTREPPLSMEEVAKQLGHNKRTIFRHFPDLCRSISSRYTKYQQQAYLQRLNDCCNEVKQAVLTLHASGEYPSEAKVSQFITRPGFFRYKQVRQTLQDARRNLGIEP